jgi:hypothetical protein
MNSKIDTPSIDTIFFDPSYMSLDDFLDQIHKVFPFAMSDDGSGKSIGRSSLSEQLNDPYNYGIRDCKLPTFLCAKYLQESGYPAMLVTYASGVHPYVVIPRPFGNVAPTDSSVAFQISFHPDEPGVKKLSMCGHTFTWGEVKNKSIRERDLRMTEVPVNEDGIRQLDQNYYAAISR